MVAIILAPQGALYPTWIYPIHLNYSTAMLHLSEMAFFNDRDRRVKSERGAVGVYTCVEASLPTFGGKQLTNIDVTQQTNIFVRQQTNIFVRQQTNILVRQQTNIFVRQETNVLLSSTRLT